MGDGKEGDFGVVGGVRGSLFFSGLDFCRLESKIWIRGGSEGVEGRFGEGDLESQVTDFFGGLSFSLRDFEGGGVADCDGIFTGIFGVSIMIKN